MNFVMDVKTIVNTNTIINMIINIMTIVNIFNNLIMNMNMIMNVITNTNNPMLIMMYPGGVYTPTNLLFMGKERHHR